MSGRLGDIDVGVVMRVDGASWKQNQIDSARIALTATGPPGYERASGRWVRRRTASMLLADAFNRVGFEADMFELDGDGRLEIVPPSG